jgi:dimethylhistidine N-methyltransferase
MSGYRESLGDKYKSVGLPAWGGSEIRSNARQTSRNITADPSVTSALSGAFSQDVLAGLSAREKMLPPKYLYDGVGSLLFERICTTPEYYVTRSEIELLTQLAPSLAKLFPERAALIEFGSGDSVKTRLLLDAAPDLSVYVPIDISEDALNIATTRLTLEYPDLTIAPVMDDFTQRIHLPATTDGLPKVGFFPGTTIGNFDNAQAVLFLRSVRQALGLHASFLVGTDLVKDEATLVAAYNDAQGATAKFNRNLLIRMNRELAGDFDPGAFDHLAMWNVAKSRIEMFLVSREDQVVRVAGRDFFFKRGERLHTENSHKFTIASFSRLCASAGWTVNETWTGGNPRVALFHLVSGTQNRDASPQLAS